jgi:nicotinamidase-related amidase
MTATNYSADDTALLIVDPYNDFMSEGVKLYERTKETADAVGFYDNMRKLIPAVRAAHIQVFIVPHHCWREGDYKGWKHINPSQMRANEDQSFAAGTWGGEFHPEFGPREGVDVIVLEHWAQSGFANTDLDSQLKQRGIQKIILVGMKQIPVSKPQLALAWSLATTLLSLRMQLLHSVMKACMLRMKSMDQRLHMLF